MWFLILLYFKKQNWSRSCTCRPAKPRTDAWGGRFASGFVGARTVRISSDMPMDLAVAANNDCIQNS